MARRRPRTATTGRGRTTAQKPNTVTGTRASGCRQPRLTTLRERTFVIAAGTSTQRSASATIPSVFEDLVQRGQTRGTLTSAEVGEALERAAISPAQVKKVLAQLSK